MDSEKAVRVVSKKSRDYVYYNITLPKEFAEELGIKSGDILHARIIEIEIDGAKRRGVFYYKP